MWGRAKGFALLASTTVLLGPAAAQATVTIGSDLGRAPTLASGCAGSCTMATSSLPSADLAPGGPISPVNGTVVMWRVRVGSSTSQTNLRVITVPSTSGVPTGGGTSSTVTPSINTTSTYSAQLPIGAGDSVGIDCCASSASQILVPTPMAVSDRWAPRLVDGAPPRPPDSMLPDEIPVNAVIEPTSAFSISQVKSGKGGKVSVTATYPNPGTLLGGDARDKSLAAASGGKKNQLYLKSAGTALAVPGQTAILEFKPTKRARTLLHERRKLKAKVKVVFTPTGGTSSSQTLKVKLKR